MHFLKFIRPLAILLISLVVSIHNYSLHAQSTAVYSKETEAKINLVEHGLGGWVQIESEPKWSLAERMKYYHANGVSIAVIKDFKIEWAKGYGWADSSNQTPVTTQTLFQAGSISKSLNGVGVLKLVQEKKLDLYTDINNYLKSWKFPYDSLSKNKKITVANLLSHTAGLTVHGFPGYEKGDTIPTLSEILDGKRPANTAPVRSAFEPSLKSQYSGGGTTVSQLIVQDITGQPYDKYMWENILRPMGMTYSSYTQPPPVENQRLLATAYYNDGKAVTGKYHIYPEQAAAGLWTNPTDLGKYIIETQLALQGKSQKGLSQAFTQLRLTPYIDTSAALGVFIEKKGEQKYFTHGGVDEGFVSQYVGSFENGNGVVVMSNTYNMAIIDEIINSIADVYKWENYYTPVVKKIITVSDSVLQDYVGQFELTPKFIITVTKNGNQLTSQATGQSTFDIYPEANNKFFPKLFDAQIEFIRNENGIVTKMVLHQNGRNTDAKKIK